jgi:hypothetical protein
MARIRRLRPTPGVLIGVVALVFALSGAAIAAPKIQTNDIAKKAVTGPKIAKDAIKSGKVVNGSLKRDDFATGVVPQFAYGRVNKAGASVTVASGAVGITGAASGGAGVICYDLAFAPASGSATVAQKPLAQRGATTELLIGAGPSCVAPFTDAATVTKDPETPFDPNDEDVYVQFVG